MSVRVEVATEPAYAVHIGADLLGKVATFPALTGSTRVALVADPRAFELHGARLAALADAPRFTHVPGEGAKTLAELEKALDFLAESSLDRRSLVVTFGGGVTTDLGGLAASLFKRGIGVVHVPTTLLAQVDAALGGKTAVNLRAGKNLAGTFHQPNSVFADTSVLTTLDEADYLSGLGEVVKTAVLAGESAFRALEDGAEAILARAPEALVEVVTQSVRTKATIVAADPNERGARRALNLGHTFAHAIERAAGYGVIPHGMAVAVGVVLAARAGLKKGCLEDTEMPRRIVELCLALGLPHELEALRTRFDVALEPNDLLAGMQHDKKGEVGKPEFVLPTRFGDCDLGASVEPALLRELLDLA